MVVKKRMKSSLKRKKVYELKTGENENSCEKRMMWLKNLSEIIEE